MTARKARRSHRSAGAALVRGAAVLVLAASLGLPAPAAAQPGTPGLDDASIAVYGTAGEGVETLGGGPTGEQAPEAERDGVAGGIRERAQVPPTQAAAPAPTGGDGRELPFTGLSAALVLGSALALLAGGALLRSLARRRPDA